MKTLCGICTLLCVAIQAGAAGFPYVKRAETEIAVGNDVLELGFRIADGRCTLTHLANKLAKRSVAITSDDFAIGVEGRAPLRTADFAFAGAREEPLAEARSLLLQFENKGEGLQLTITYTLGVGAFVRRSLHLSAAKPLPIRQVDAWLVGIEGTASHQGFGEPVFLDDTFWGLEFPGGHNSFANGIVKLTHFPGRTTDRFASKTAVLGVAEPGRVAESFRRYHQFEVIAFAKAPLFVNYNTWWTLMPPTEKNCVELIRLFKEKLFDPYGESFDTFTIDDGWDKKETLWELVPERFPNGFGPLVEPLKAMKANLGLWLSPSSGYSHAPHLAKLGYEHNSNPWYCCQSGPRYRRDIAQRVTALAKQYDLAFYKFDGFCPSCEAEGHGHLPGNFAREANIDAYIELMTAARRARQGIYLDPTCGMWLSPWWLGYCDSIWGSVSGDYPDVIVPAPVIRDSATTTRDAVFRQRCREHPGYPPAAIEHLGIIVITPEKWEDNAMAVVGRGCRLLTLYINPKHFTKGDRDWAFLASLLKWTRRHAATLSHTTLIGGDPLQREVYGYAHFRGSEGILCLRNPFIEPQTVTLKLDESVGLTRAAADGALVARVVYPREEARWPALRHGDTLDVKLQAYETAMLHVGRTGAGPVLCGVRAHETAREGTRLSYAVYGRAGQKVHALFPGWAREASATFDGQPASGGLDMDELLQARFDFPGQEQPLTVAGSTLAVQAAGASWQLVGECVANVPTGTRATMHLMCDPRGGAGAIGCTARVSGKAVQVRAVRSGGKQAHSRHPWTWFEFDLPAGRSAVTIAIKPSKDGGAFRGEVGWWLWAEHPLEKHTLTLDFKEPLPPAPKEPLPLPIAMETEREIITVQAPKVFRTPKQWPKLDKPSIYLDEVPPDEAKQDWGRLQRNQSVWEKPMIVAGRTFTRGLGTHADSRIVYDLTGGKFRRFRCLVGRDEHAMEGKVVFQVWLDGKKVFDSGPMGKTTPAKPVDVDISGAAVLELRTLDGGDGIGGDHGNWANAELVR